MRSFKMAIVICVTVWVMLQIVFAQSMSDVSGTPYEEAVMRLKTLGIMVGDDGFRVDDKVTRAELTAIMVRVMGLSDHAKATASETVFKDVKPSHWAAGAIDLAHSMGIIQGKGDGTFAPDAYVTYDEAVKMVMCALGYEPAAKEKGGYPLGYTILASQEDVLKGVEGVKGEAITRGNIAILVDNALITPKMIKDGYGPKSYYVKSGTGNTVEETLLFHQLRVERYKVFVTKVDGSEMTVTIQDENIHPAYKYRNGGSYSLPVVEGLKINGYENTEVTIWIKDKKICSVIHDDNTSIYDYIDQVNRNASHTAVYTVSNIDQIRFKHDGTHYDLKRDAEGQISAAVNVNKQGTTNAERKFVDCFAIASLENGDISTLSVYDMLQGGIITEVTNDAIRYTLGDITNKQLSGLSSTDNLLVIIDNKPAELSDLKPDMLFDYWVKDNTYEDFVIVASSKKLVGQFTQANDEFLKIAAEKLYRDERFGVYFSIENGAKYAKEDRTEGFLTKDVTAYVDGKNEIRYVRLSLEDSESEFYGVVTGAWAEGEQYIKVYKAVGIEGKEVTYQLDLVRSEVQFDELRVKDTSGLGTYKFTLDSKGKVRKIETITWIARTVSGEFSDSAKAEVGGVFFDKAIVISLLDKDNKFAPSVVKWSSMQSKVTSGTEFKFDKLINPNIAIISAGVNNITYDYSDFGFVSDISKVSSDAYEITVETANGKRAYVAGESFLTTESGKHVEKNTYIVYRGGLVGGGTIKIIEVYDLKRDAVTITSTTKVDRGAFVTDKVNYVDSNIIQYTVLDPEGKEMQINPLGFRDNAVVFELSQENTFIKRSLSDLSTDDLIYILRYEGDIKGVLYQKR